MSNREKTSWCRFGTVDYSGPNIGTEEQITWIGRNCDYAIVQTNGIERTRRYTEMGLQTYAYLSGSDQYEAREPAAWMMAKLEERGQSGERLWLHYSEDTTVRLRGRDVAYAAESRAVVYEPDGERRLLNLFDPTVREVYIEYCKTQLCIDAGSHGAMLDNCSVRLHNTGVISGGGILEAGGLRLATVEFDAEWKPAIEALAADCNRLGLLAQMNMTNNTTAQYQAVAEQSGVFHEYAFDSPYRITDPQEVKRKYDQQITEEVLQGSKVYLTGSGWQVDATNPESKYEHDDMLLAAAALWWVMQDSEAGQGWRLSRPTLEQSNQLQAPDWWRDKERGIWYLEDGSKRPAPIEEIWMPGGLAFGRWRGTHYGVFVPRRSWTDHGGTEPVPVPLPGGSEYKLLDADGNPVAPISSEILITPGLGVILELVTDTPPEPTPPPDKSVYHEVADSLQRIAEVTLEESERLRGLGDE